MQKQINYCKVEILVFDLNCFSPPQFRKYFNDFCQFIQKLNYNLESYSYL